MRAPVRKLLKLSNYLSNNTRLGNINGHMADNGLAAKDTAAWSMENCEAASAYRATAERIPSCRGARRRELVTVMHNSEPMILRRVSSSARRPHYSLPWEASSNAQALTVTASACAWVTSSRSFATSTASWAKRSTKEKRKEQQQKGGSVKSKKEGVVRSQEGKVLSFLPLH
jgi:hypothetical protein